MTCNIYALLVGIDNYPHPVPSLKGCVNDVADVEEYLRGRIDPDKFKLHLLTLKNQEATRQAIVDGFRQHLCLASSDDVVIFYYSGHGSQELVPPEFWHLELDRIGETLVCWDSRTETSWDLADKELTLLIAEVAEKQPHMTIIMDCCHLGSGVSSPLQQTAVRCIPADKRQRPSSSYIFSLQDALELSVTYRRLEEQPTGWVLPNKPNILLRACQNHEDAREYFGNSQNRGAFSFFLMEVLKRTNGNLTYLTLFQRVETLVLCKVAGQSPHLEAINPEDIHQPFLGGAIAQRNPYFTVTYHQDYGWVIDGGIVHGISPTTENETTRLALFPIDSELKQLRHIADAAGEAEVIEVLPQLSKVRMRRLGIEDWESEIPHSSVFKAVVTDLPVPPLGIYLEGNEAGVMRIRQALLEMGAFYVREVTELEKAEFRVLADNRHYLIVRPANDRPLIAPIVNNTLESALQVVSYLEHISRWMNVAELSSPATSQIQPDAVQIKIYHNHQEIEEPQIRLNYKLKGSGKWRQPTFRLKLTNTSSERLYCTLLDLTERYAINADLLQGGGVWLQPREEVWIPGEKPFYANVPQELWEQGITEFKDIFKLIVSTAEFDASLLKQQNLDFPQTGSTEVIRDAADRASTLNRLIKRIQTPNINDIPSPEEICDDWVTSEVAIATIRPLNATLVPSEGEGISLGVGVVLQPHPSLRAVARITTVAQSTEDLGNFILPAILRQTPQAAEPFQFTPSCWGNAPKLSALELSVSELEADTIQTVTPQQPLKLLVDTSLQEREYILPVGYDGRFFLPLGVGYARDGKTEIRLDRLPESVLKGKASVGGSIRIFFLKVLNQKQVLEFEDSSLISLNQPRQELETVKEQVAFLGRIVLCVHGIIGEARSMVKSLQQVEIEADGQQQVLANLFDLVLTFNCEDGKSIEENGRLLKQKLEAVGLGASHNKVLHVVAHSIGGLVCRWFIEREGGDRIANHLIMLGTPNAGSPWPSVKAWATSVLGIELNNLSAITPSVSVWAALLSASTAETTDVLWQQVQPGSSLLQSLAVSPDPGIPYTIIAGNTSLRPAAMQSQPGQPSPLEQLLQKLFNSDVALSFFYEPNDIIASTDSIKSISWERSPQPKLQEVGCNHFGYLIHKAVLDILWQALSQDPVREIKSTSHQVAIQDMAPPIFPMEGESNTFDSDWISETISIIQERESAIDAESQRQARDLSPTPLHFDTPTMADPSLQERGQKLTPPINPVPISGSQLEAGQVNQTLKQRRGLNSIAISVIALLLAAIAVVGAMQWQHSHEQEPRKQQRNSSALQAIGLTGLKPHIFTTRGKAEGH